MQEIIISTITSLKGDSKIFFLQLWKGRDEFRFLKSGRQEGNHSLDIYFIFIVLSNFFLYKSFIFKGESKKRATLCL